MSYHEVVLNAASGVSASYVVDKIAFFFRLISIAIISPVLLLGLMDVTAYVIARTLHAPKDKRRRDMKSVEPQTAIASSASAPTSPTSQSPPIPRAGSTMTIPGFSSAQVQPSWLAFHAAAEKLSGVGEFSPPITRATTPSNERPSITSSLFMTPAAPASSATSGSREKGPGSSSMDWEPISLEDVDHSQQQLGRS
ncbi:hypothetical protein DL93DRAFT_2156230 [Clavulina sp. PMI_390]|nr:hypothetical protein DL93DRAFT_2156230 [Clavulina sp. PMI_390]